MTATVPVQFTKRVPPYHVGEVAAFPPDVSDALIVQGAAKQHTIPPKELEAARKAEAGRLAAMENQGNIGTLGAQIATALRAGAAN